MQILKTRTISSANSSKEFANNSNPKKFYSVKKINYKNN